MLALVTSSSFVITVKIVANNFANKPSMKPSMTICKIKKLQVVMWTAYEEWYRCQEERYNIRIQTRSKHYSEQLRHISSDMKVNSGSVPGIDLN